jgi:hypothetical protein
LETPNGGNFGYPDRGTAADSATFVA